MRQTPLLFPFALALIFALFGTALLPHVKIFVFAPFLALLYNKCSFQASLWIASLCGLGVDLLSSGLSFGSHALNGCLTTLLLYRQKRHFFEDKPLALCLFTQLISIVSTLLQWLLLPIFDRPLAFSGMLLATDLLVMPLIDAVYAFLWFCCPMMLYAHIRKVGMRAFLKRLARKFGHKATESGD